MLPSLRMQWVLSGEHFRFGSKGLTVWDCVVIVMLFIVAKYHGVSRFFLGDLMYALREKY